MSSHVTDLLVVNLISCKMLLQLFLLPASQRFIVFVFWFYLHIAQHSSLFGIRIVFTKYNKKKKVSCQWRDRSIALFGKKCQIVQWSKTNIKNKIPHYSWERVGITILLLYTMAVSQTPAFQKLPRWEYFTHQVKK